MSEMQSAPEGSANAVQSRVARKRLVARLSMIGATVLVLGLTAGAAFVLQPSSSAVGPASDLPGTGHDAWSRGEERMALSPAWLALNDAMATGDREEFLSFAEGDARDALARWWDGTRTIGWDLAFALPSGLYDAESGESSFQIILGAELAFEGEADRGSGIQSAGQKLVQTFTYDVTYSANEGDQLVISEAAPTADSHMPWDEGEIYAVKRDHVVLFGLASEQELIDSAIDEAESAAVLVFDTITAMGGTIPLEGFVATITDSQETYDRWVGASSIAFETSGIAKNFPKPPGSVAFIDPGIASGEGSSGTITFIAPELSDQRKSVFVHEFAHAAQESAAPGLGGDVVGRPSKMEGFATFFESQAGLRNGYFASPDTLDRILTLGELVFADEYFDSAEPRPFYDAAGSYYQFVADTGGDPWQLAIRRNDPEGLIALGVEQGEQFGVSQWQEWARQQAG